LSAVQNAPTAGLPPTGGAFHTADKQKKFAEKVNKHIISRSKATLGVKG